MQKALADLRALVTFMGREADEYPSPEADARYAVAVQALHLVEDADELERVKARRESER